MFLRDHVTSVFGDRWQGHPGDYNPMFNKLTENITVLNEEVLKYNGKTIKTSEGTLDADLFINTVPLDKLFYDDYMFNYRGVTWVYTLLDTKEALPTYLTSFPNTYGFTRIMEYKHQSLQKSDKTLLSFAFPFDISDESEPYENDYQAEALAFIDRFFPGKLIDSFIKTKKLVYPIATPENINLFWHEMGKVSKLDNLITCGRLGLYCYVSMDTCVDQSYQIVEIVNKWKGYTPKQRMTFYKQLRERQT